MPQRAQRPLSAYNLFFKVQRYLLINDKPDLRTTEEVHQICNEIHLLMSEKPDKKKGKRLHRKTHGKIGFADLGKMIGQRWRNCKSDIKACFEQIAHEEKNNYYRMMKGKQKSKSFVETVTKRNDEPYNIEDSKQADEAQTKISGYADDSNFDGIISMGVTSHPCKLEGKIEVDMEPLPYRIGKEASPTHHENDIDYETFEFVVSVFGSSCNQLENV